MRNLGFSFGRTPEDRDKEYAELERRLSQEAKAQQQPTPTRINTPISTNPFLHPTTSNIVHYKNYILLEAKTHGSYCYPDLLVCKYRLPHTNKSQKAAHQLGFNVANTAQEANGRWYVGNINWQQGLSLNLMLGGQTLTPRQFEDFLLLLKSGKAFDGKGDRIRETELSDILNEIFEKRNPYRSEWLDANFKYLDSKGQPIISKEKGDFFINHNHELKNGVLVPKYCEKLEPCLMEDIIVELSSMNHQGMATKKGRDIYHFIPHFGSFAPINKNNSVAKFGTNNLGTNINYDTDALRTNNETGIRLVLSKTNGGIK